MLLRRNWLDLERRLQFGRISVPFSHPEFFFLIALDRHWSLGITTIISDSINRLFLLWDCNCFASFIALIDSIMRTAIVLKQITYVCPRFRQREFVFSKPLLRKFCNFLNLYQNTPQNTPYFDNFFSGKRWITCG